MEFPTFDPGSTGAEGVSTWGRCIDSSGAPTLNCIPVVFQIFVHNAYMFVGIVAVFLVMYSGFKFLTSGGDAKQVQSAQQTLTYAIIGLVVVILSFLVIQLVSVITGVECIKMFGFTNCR